jgi:alkylated DNA repair protein alkB family protein 8
MEKTFVHDVYDTIAGHFSETRYKPWAGVRTFLATVPSGSSILEIGCGNGKNLGERPDCIVFGCDPCKPLLDYAQSQYPSANLVVANGLALPYTTASMDVVLSIAVFHHLATVGARRQFLKEFARVYKGTAGGMLTVWSHESVEPSWQPLVERGDYLVPWTHKQDGTVYQRYYHVFDKEELVELFEGILPIREVTSECGNWYVFV